MENWDIDVSSSNVEEFSELFGGLTSRVRSGISSVRNRTSGSTRPTIRSSSSSSTATRKPSSGSVTTRTPSGGAMGSNVATRKPRRTVDHSGRGVMVLNDGSKIPSSYIKKV